MRTFLSTALILLLSYSSLAQDAITHNRSRNSMYELLSKKNNNYTPEINNKHYVNKLFLPGEIYYENKKTSGDYSLRYNAYKDLIELANNKESDFVLRNPKISCKISGVKYVYTNYVKKDDLKQGYLKVLHKDDNFTLLERESIVFKEGRKAKTSLTASVPAKYIRYNSFYISKDNKPAKEISNKKRTFLNNFDKKNKTKIKSFMKKKKINLKKSRDVIKLYKYINSL